MATVLLGGVTAGLVVAQAWLIANVVSRVVVGHEARRTGQDARRAAVSSRSSVGRRWAGSGSGWPIGPRQRRSRTCAARLVERIALLGPAGIERERSGSLVVLATSGVDALDSFFARYLPQLFLAVIVPVTVIVVVLGSDWISAVIIAVTVPLIPLFMALVGASTKARMQRQARLLERLAGHFLDVVAGLPTLKVFGRAKAQVAADPRHHRPVPHGDDGHPQGGVLVVADSRASGHFLRRPRGGGRRTAPVGRSSDVGCGPIRAHSRPRGVPSLSAL